MDIIWLSINKLVHEAIIPAPDKIQVQLSSLFSRHFSAWKDATLPSLWTSPLSGCFKANFDVTVRNSFSVAAAVISDTSGAIIFAATSKLLGTDALMGEAAAALLASRLALSSDLDNISIEGDSFLVILALNSPSLFSSWNFCNLISDCCLVLDSFQSWNALKVSRSANFKAHSLAKWAASTRVFGSILK
jgi:hypothetical protein